MALAAVASQPGASAVAVRSHGCLAPAIAYPRFRPLILGAFVSSVSHIASSNRGSSRWFAVLVAAAWVSLATQPASATWRNVRDVSRGTAQVLEKGELTFGIFAPIAYGVTDSLTVQSSPIFDLLLIPNVGARYRFLRTDRLVLAATLSYKQAFLTPTQRPFHCSPAHILLDRRRFPPLPPPLMPFEGLQI